MMVINNGVLITSGCEHFGETIDLVRQREAHQSIMILLLISIP